MIVFDAPSIQELRKHGAFAGMCRWQAIGFSIAWASRLFGQTSGSLEFFVALTAPIYDPEPRNGALPAGASFRLHHNVDGRLALAIPAGFDKSCRFVDL